MENINIKKRYNLPDEIIYCKKCVISNQRPRITFDKNGVCSACNYFEFKRKIDWEQREKELVEILDTHRSKDGSYDCVVPSSGGKDSAFVAHELKSKYKICLLYTSPSPRD